MEFECGKEQCVLSRISASNGRRLEDGKGLHGHCTSVVLVNVALEEVDCEDIDAALCITMHRKHSIEDYKGKESEILFVLHEFDGSIFDHLLSNKALIVGVTALKELLHKGQTMLSLNFPIFSLSMDKMVVCLTGFLYSEHVGEMASLICYMGGKVMTEVDPSTTCVVTGNYWTDEMESALEYSIPIVTHEWIIENWQKRMEIGHSAHMNMDDYKVKPFTFANVSFVGFQPDEVTKMVKVLKENGGCHVQPDDTKCTHMILQSCAEANVEALSTNAMVVKVDWFWVSIQQNNVVNPKNYLVTTFDALEIYDQAIGGGEDTIADSGIGDDEVDILVIERNPRVLLITEFIQTESNYVSILDAIMSIKEGVEDAKQPGGPILNALEVKSIFGGMSMIQRVHHEMLSNFEEECDIIQESFPIGQILLKHASEISKVYPPFVNFFESSQAALRSYDSQNFRFHAYLQLCKNKPECGRQSLGELMIRPVQRLGSIVLLAKGIMKRTDTGNPDHPFLKEAVLKIFEAVSSINKDKERTQKMYQIFDIFHSIVDCPPRLVSSSRYFLFEFEAFDVNGFDNLGSLFQLFVFSDLIEVSKVIGSSRKSATEKTLQHFKLIPFSEVHGIIDIIDSENAKNTFGIAFRNEDEKTMCFGLPLENMNKDEYLSQFCNAIAMNQCIKDPMTLLYEVDPYYLDIKTSDKGTKGRGTLVFQLNQALEICKAPMKITKDVLAFFHLRDNLKKSSNHPKSLSCNELATMMKTSGGSVERSLSLSAKIMKKM